MLYGLLQDLDISHYYGELAPTCFKRVHVSFCPSLFPYPDTPHASPFPFYKLPSQLLSLLELYCNFSESQWAGLPTDFRWPGWGLTAAHHAILLWPAALPLGTALFHLSLIRQLSVVSLLVGPSRRPVRYSQANSQGLERNQESLASSTQGGSSLQGHILFLPTDRYFM